MFTFYLQAKKKKKTRIIKSRQDSRKTQQETDLVVRGLLRNHIHPPKPTENNNNRLKCIGG